MNTKHFPTCGKTHCRFYDPNLSIWTGSSREAWHLVKSTSNCLMCKHFIRPDLLTPHQIEIVDDYEEQ